MKKIYQVNVKYFYVSNGIDYLSACSPFTNGLAYKDKNTAIVVAQSILNDHKELDDTSSVSKLEKVDTSNNLVGIITKKYGSVQRIVVEVEEIEIVK